ncbi:phospholipase a2-activating protein [Anaeramoeba flamelloides]|uniref:Phospholipase a2-activating protein n=1 Tax=Anaeramoeba flamelloides TaxID=1746091 RepID=A0AAV7Z2Z6_9EUKA|nr:phospholipase a2-activating protein [Anaeramoeba flamelloides]
MSKYKTFTLSSQFFGHEIRVRSLALIDKNHFVSVGYDQNLKLWKRKDKTNLFECFRTILAHGRYIYKVIVIQGSELENFGQYEDGLVVTSGLDCVAKVWDLSLLMDENIESEEIKAELTLEGHTGNITGLHFTPELNIITCSWDQTIKIWDLEGNCTKTLKGHEGAVYDALFLENGKLLTVSGDSKINIWEGGTCIGGITDHTLPVRSIKSITKSSFITSSNDELCCVFSNYGTKVDYKLQGHTSYVYNVNVFPETDDTFVTSSEDKSIRIWKRNVCNQIIHHPTTVFETLLIPSPTDNSKYDIATACLDGMIRIFSQDEALTADPETIQLFESSLSDRTLNNDMIGGMRRDQIPDVSSLHSSTGTRDGQTKIVINKGKPEAYSWSVKAESWQLIGEVMSDPNQRKDSTIGTKSVLNGKEYDYVFNISLETGQKLQFGYNKSENPYLAAERFLKVNRLDPVYLEQVVEFIINNTGGTNQGFTRKSKDPFTGKNSYRPSHNQQSNKKGVNYDPYTGSGSYHTGKTYNNQPQQQQNYSSSQSTTRTNYDPFTGKGSYSTKSKQTQTQTQTQTQEKKTFKTFPLRSPIKFTKFKSEILIQNLKQIFNESQNQESNCTQEDLDQVINLVNCIQKKETIDELDLLTVISILTIWPVSKVHPLIDILRLVVINEEGSSLLLNFYNKQDINIFQTILEISDNFYFSQSQEFNTIPFLVFSFRFIANLFSQPELLKTIQTILPKLLSISENYINDKKKLLRLAVSTFLLNYSHYLRNKKNEKDEETKGLLLNLLAKFAILETDKLVFLRLISAIGTLIYQNETLTFILVSLDLSKILKKTESFSDQKIKLSLTELRQITEF